MAEIHIAAEKDAEAIQLCCERAFKGYIPIIGKKPAPMYYNYLNEIRKGTVLAAFENSAVAGFALIKDGGNDFMWLDVLAADPSFEGKGVGRALLSACESFILQNGKSECRLYTNVKFERTCRIYLHYGFEIYDTVQENGYDRYYMKKLLK